MMPFVGSFTIRWFRMTMRVWKEAQISSTKFRQILESVFWSLMLVPVWWVCEPSLFWQCHCWGQSQERISELQSQIAQSEAFSLPCRDLELAQWILSLVGDGGGDGWWWSSQNGLVFRPLLQLWKLRWRAKVWESVPQCSPQSMYAFQHQEPRSPVVLEWRYLDSVDLFGNLRLSPDFETPDFYDTPQHEEDENVSWVIMPDQRRYCMTGHTVACL